MLHGYAGALPQTIACEGGISVYNDGRDTWDHATVTLRYPGELTAVHSLCLFGPSRADIQISGDEGTIESVGPVFQVSQLKRGTKGSNRIQPIDLIRAAKSWRRSRGGPVVRRFPGLRSNRQEARCQSRPRAGRLANLLAR